MELEVVPIYVNEIVSGNGVGVRNGDGDGGGTGCGNGYVSMFFPDLDSPGSHFANALNKPIHVGTDTGYGSGLEK